MRGTMRIGEMAQASGLTVSALRFYDRAGVLVPAAAAVPVTGYRSYAPDQVATARLLAGLRRVGMPLGQISEVLAGIEHTAWVRRALQAHLRRLEDGLEDARREIARVCAALDDELGGDSTVAVNAADLVSVLDAVAYAMSTDPDLPGLGGVLLEADATGAHVVATDRYRLAAISAAATVLDGPPMAVTLPAGLVAAARGLPPIGSVTVTVSAGRVTVDAGGVVLSGTAVRPAFPLWRSRLPRTPTRRIPVDSTHLRRTVLQARPAIRGVGVDGHDVVLLRVDAEHGPAFGGPAPGPGWATGVDREFLLQAVDAAGAGQLTLELDGPLDPLVLRSASTDSLSVLMPVRLPA